MIYELLIGCHIKSFTKVILPHKVHGMKDETLASELSIKNLSKYDETDD